MIKKLEVALLLVVLMISTAGMQTQGKETKYIVGYTYKKITKTKKTYMGKFWVTHYCPCSYCCGVGGGKVTASGTTPTAGRTVGVNPNLLPYGTKLKIGKRSGYVAEDTGGGIGWKHLDVFCSNHQEALDAGVGYQKVWIITKRKKVVKVPIYKEMEDDEIPLATE